MDTIDELIACLETPFDKHQSASKRSEQFEKQQAAVEKLKRIGAPAVEPLIAVLRRPDSPGHMTTAFLLGDLRDRRAVESLINLLKNRPPIPRQVPQEWGDTLRSVLSHFWHDFRNPPPPDPSEGSRSAAARALGEIGDSSAAEALFEAGMQDPSGEVAVEAGTALAILGDSRAADVLIAARQLSLSWPYEAQASSYLGQTGDPRVIPILIRNLGYPRDDVQELAAEGLAKCGKAAFEPLMAALTHASADVRGYAAFALGKLGDPRALPELGRLAREDTAKMSLGERVQEKASKAAKTIREQSRAQ
jgi:HEAT repeat protein